jgi:ABC-type polysaccharide/polyol phosphate export permease
VFDKQWVSAQDMFALYAIALVAWVISYAVFNRLKVRVAEEL